MNDIDPNPFAGNPRPPVALIAGPTASGKSGLAIALARALHDAGRGAVVVNADASQVYADIPILSAAPPPAERAGIHHRLFGHIDGAVAHNAAAWAAEARAVVADAHGRGAIPILVGGTGLYLRTLIDGIAPVPAIDPDVRARVRAMPMADAHAALAVRDAAAAARLHPNDRTRIARALEVVESSGRTLDEWQLRRSGGIGDAIRLVPLILLPPRDWLRDRCAERFGAMVKDGAADEVAALMARRLDPALPVMNAIGVREIAGWIAGDTDRETAEARAIDSTRQYAKRQYTWFSHQPPAGWERFSAELNDQDTALLAIKLRDMLLTG